MKKFIVTKEKMTKREIQEWFLPSGSNIASAVFGGFDDAKEYMQKEIVSAYKQTRINEKECYPCTEYVRRASAKDNLSVLSLNEMITKTIYAPAYKIREINALDIRKVDEKGRSYAFFANSDILVAQYKGISIRLNTFNMDSVSSPYFFEYTQTNEKGEVKKSIKITLTYTGSWRIQYPGKVYLSGFPKITLGNYWQDKEGKTKSPLSWIEISNESGYKMFLTERVIDIGRFDAKSNQWEKSELRKWLNSEFYDTCFSAEEKERIMKNTEGDYVSLLSRDELCKTIPLSDEWRALYTPYALEKEQVRCEKSFYMDDVNWFLKTEGWKSSYDFFRPVENTTSVTHDGMIWFTSSVNGIYGIRPVILIKD